MAEVYIVRINAPGRAAPGYREQISGQEFWAASVKRSAIDAARVLAEAASRAIVLSQPPGMDLQERRDLFEANL